PAVLEATKSFQWLGAKNCPFLRLLSPRPAVQPGWQGIESATRGMESPPQGFESKAQENETQTQGNENR
ncbi:MAG: hypothetical protein WBQ45_05490, partial [Roseiarcus sp.]